MLWGKERSNHVSNNKRHQSSCKTCKAIKAQMNGSDLVQNEHNDISLGSVASHESYTEAPSQNAGEVFSQPFDMSWTEEDLDRFLQDGW